MNEAVTLRSLREGDETAAKDAHAELAEDGFTFLLGWDGQEWEAYLAQLEKERGEDVAPGRVPATFLGVYAGERLVGRISIRHELNEHLRTVGGHIGYAIRPGERGKGYATAALREALRLCRGLGIEHALVTCDSTNEASRRTIERCGGVLEDEVPVEGGPSKLRYWIQVGS